MRKNKTQQLNIKKSEEILYNPQFPQLFIGYTDKYIYICM